MNTLVLPRIRFLPAIFLLILGLMLIVPAPPARAFEGRVYGNVLVKSGQTVDEVSTTVGDITVAPGAHVEGNVNSGVGNIRVEGPVGGDVRSGSGNIEISAPIGGGVDAGNGNVYVNAPVRGNVEVGQGSVRYGPRAWIGGRVICRSSCSMPKERVSQLRASSTATDFQGGDFNNTSGTVSSHGDGAGGPGFVGWMLATIAFMACSVLLSVVIPRPLTSAARSLEVFPGRSLLYGIASVPAVAIMAVVLAVSVVGIPALLLLAPAYLALVIFGALVIAYFLGRRVLFATGRYRGGNALAAVVGAVIVAATALIPIFGKLVLYTLVLLGTGAVISAIISRFRSRTTY